MIGGRADTSDSFLEFGDPSAALDPLIVWMKQLVSREQLGEPGREAGESGGEGTGRGGGIGRGVSLTVSPHEGDLHGCATARASPHSDLPTCAPGPCGRHVHVGDVRQ